MAKTLDSTDRRRIDRRSRGLCTLCGKNAHGRALCVKHRTQRREAAQRRMKYKPWQPGGPGRPPIGREPEAQRADIHKTIDALRDKLQMRRTQCRQLVQEIAAWKAKLKELRAKSP